VQLSREQVISVGALASLLLVCAFAVGLSLQMRFDARNELTRRQAVWSRLGAHARLGTGAHGRKSDAAPAAAYLDAPTASLAAAQLQGYLSRVASSHHATLISYGAEPARREDSPDAIRVQATLDIGQKALKGLLYQLESQTPYVFVDLLMVKPTSTAGQRGEGDPSLRLTLGLRALWRRGSA
jgi:general secretion pathway protein M